MCKKITLEKYQIIGIISIINFAISMYNFAKGTIKLAILGIKLANWYKNRYILV